MRRIVTVISLTISIIMVSCTEVPECPESSVPEIISITSLPKTCTATLISDLKSVPKGKVECGFYLGTDRNNLTRHKGELYGASFRLSIDNLSESTTYWFKAFVSNGRNEIASGFESFITEPAPEEPSEPSDPENPEEPENPTEPENPEDPDTSSEPDNPSEPENPSDPVGPEDPDTPAEPDDPSEPENPEDPEEPEEPVGPENPEEPVEFTTEIGEISAAEVNGIVELSAVLDGDVSLVTECWFLVGSTEDNLSKIKGAINGSSFKAYLAGLSPGTYYYKAVMTDGKTTKESDLSSFTLNE